MMILGRMIAKRVGTITLNVQFSCRLCIRKPFDCKLSSKRRVEKGDRHLAATQNLRQFHIVARSQSPFSTVCQKPNGRSVPGGTAGRRLISASVLKGSYSSRAGMSLRS